MRHLTGTPYKSHSVNVCPWMNTGPSFLEAPRWSGASSQFLITHFPFNSQKPCEVGFITLIPHKNKWRLREFKKLAQGLGPSEEPGAVPESIKAPAPNPGLSRYTSVSGGPLINHLIKAGMMPVKFRQQLISHHFHKRSTSLTEMLHAGFSPTCQHCFEPPTSH